MYQLGRLNKKALEFDFSDAFYDVLISVDGNIFTGSKQDFTNIFHGSRGKSQNRPLIFLIFPALIGFQLIKRRSVGR